MIVRTHLNSLFDSLLEQNLLRIIDPFSQVEISHIAKIINIPEKNVEMKLSKMILDKTLNGILDQGTGCLVVLEAQKEDVTSAFIFRNLMISP